MSLEKEIKQGADEAIQQATGVPAPSLRGAIGPMQYIKERMAASAGVIPPGKEFSTEVTSNVIAPQSTSLPPAEPAAVVPVGGGDDGGGATQEFIVDMNGTLQFWDFVATFNRNV